MIFRKASILTDTPLLSPLSTLIPARERGRIEDGLLSPLWGEGYLREREGIYLSAIFVAEGCVNSTLCVTSFGTTLHLTVLSFAMHLSA